MHILSLALAADLSGPTFPSQPAAAACFDGFGVPLVGRLVKAWIGDRAVDPDSRCVPKVESLGV